MCGIAGIVRLGSHQPVTRDELQAMTSTLVHRGPNDEGLLVDGTVGIGMRRLSIIDVAGGHQPIHNEDRSAAIVFNGEIFNHEALRPDLERAGHRYATRSDTETILHLYDEHGDDCVDPLRGMFAFAIWDRAKRRVLLARDRLGIKPLYHCQTAQGLLFASEIKALLAHPAVPRTLDWTALDAYFTYGYIPAPWTAYAAIRQLLPGHTMVVDHGGARVARYWDLEMGPKHQGSADELSEELLRRLGESVQLRLLSEVPLGAFLSGGIDSSLIVALMSRLSVEPVRTFTIGYGGSTGSFLDERPVAAEVSRKFRTAHHPFEVQPQVEAAIDVALRAFDQPFADDSLVPTHHICQLARESVTVVLTGLGGDENFAGYERYLGLRYSEWYERVPRLVQHRLVRPLVLALKEQRGGHYRINHLKRFVLGAGLPASVRWQRYAAILSTEQRRQLYRPETAAQIDFEAVERKGYEHFLACDSDDPLDRALYQDIKMYLPDDILALTDRIGMHHSLELRVPFTDHTLMEFCARLPNTMKIHGRQKKWLLRRAARSQLPEAVFAQRKQGFAAPMAQWLRGDLRGLVERELGTESIARGGVFEPAAVARAVNDHVARRSQGDKLLFALLVFQRWWGR